ncbi:Uncharacterised protein [Serratia quinivorans]|nr:hypothetical protein 220p1_00055 [Serratia entomophila]CAI1943828.1 Uncharacterised protein [Serratia quinivorans]CAI2159881.1 Uncharacterised protein [Serratia quinivorans]
MKKLKQQYKYAVTYPGCRFLGVYYPLLKNWLHKRFSTRQEKSFFISTLLNTKNIQLS